MTRIRVMAVYRLVFAVAVIVAVVAQFGVTLSNHYSIVNFFSYFTNLSNIIAVVVFAIGAVRLLRRTPDSTDWSVVRFCSTVNMVFVGLVFNIVLDINAVGAVIPWVNVIVHMIMPVAVLVDWIVLPPQTRLPWRIAFTGLLFPIVYSIYSLIRGARTGFYPYPFYNADALGGVGPLVLFLAALMVGLAVLSAVILLISWVRASKATSGLTVGASRSPS